MELKYDDVIIAGRFLVEAGVVEVPERSIGLICGPNGAGKSLLLRKLMDRARNTGMSVCLLNQSKEALVLSAPVLENISMTSDRKRCEDIRSAVEKLGFSDLLSKNIARLSGGEARLVCILRCLLSNSGLVLMDEPTNDLDYDMVNRLKKLLTDIRGRKTIIIVSHDDRMVKLADLIYEIRDEKLLRNMPERPVCDENPENVRGNQESIELKERHEDLKENYDGKTHRSKFIRRLFALNVCPLFAGLMLCVIFYYPSKSIINTTRVLDEDRAPNQVLLFQFSSRWAMGEYEDPGALNSILTAEFVNALRTGSLKESMTALQAAERYADECYYVVYHSLDIPSTEAYDVYPLEFNDPWETQNMTVLGQIVQDKVLEGEAVINCFRDTGGFFSAPFFYRDERGIVFDPVQWHRTADAMASEWPLCCASYVVMKDGHTVDEFFESAAFHDLYSRQVYVTSGEIYRTTYEVERLRNIWQKLPFVLLSMLLLLIICVCSTIIYLFTQRVKIRACRDYGISVRELYANCEGRLCNRLLLVGTVAAFGLWTFLNTRKLPFVQTNWIYWAAMVLEASVFFYVQRKITKLYLQKCYRWNAR